jgi:adenylate cyclase class IV
MGKGRGLRALMLALLRTVLGWIVRRSAAKGHLEVERKFSLALSEVENLPIRLRELGLKPAGSVTMTDTFIPARKKGEMVRIRDEMTSGTARSLVTLKSWVYLPDGNKERLESEAVISPLFRTLAIVMARYASAKELLSFSKERALFEGTVGARHMVASLDRVSGLGQFSGHFLEVETIVPMGEDPTDARKEIFKFVETLFGKPREDVQRSYMEMLEISRQR